MKKNRKLIITLVVVIAVVVGITICVYAGTRSDNTISGTGSVSTTTSSSDQGNTISSSTASDTAISTAVSDYGIQESSVCDLDVEKEYEGGKYVWEVTFDAMDKNDQYCEFEYNVSCDDGSITNHHKEYEDQDDHCDHDGSAASTSSGSSASSSGTV
ncbi:MAG: hypothetical protein ACOYJI_03035 [Anaerovoracaceae bacterium]